LHKAKILAKRVFVDYKNSAGSYYYNRELSRLFKTSKNDKILDIQLFSFIIVSKEI